MTRFRHSLGEFCVRRTVAFQEILKLSYFLSKTEHMAEPMFTTKLYSKVLVSSISFENGNNCDSLFEPDVMPILRHI